LELDMDDVGFVRFTMAAQPEPKLPETIAKVKFNVDEGTPGQHRYPLEAVDRLPNPNDLDMNFVDPGYRYILDFPKLLGSLKKASILWPWQNYLLVAPNLAELNISTFGDTSGQNGSVLWGDLRPLKSLEKVRLTNFPTSTLVGLPSIPQLHHATMRRAEWNLDDHSKRMIAELEDAQVTFVENESES
jgi:hypothetical protein